MHSPAARRWLFVLRWDLDWPGGVSQVVRALREEMLSRTDVEPMLFVSGWATRTPRYDSDAKPAKWRGRLYGPPPGTGVVQFILHLLGAIACVPGLARMLRSESIDTINVHFANPGMLSFALARRVRAARRLVVSLHGSDVVNMAKANGRERLLWRFMLASADFQLTMNTVTPWSTAHFTKLFFSFRSRM